MYMQSLLMMNIMRQKRYRMPVPQKLPMKPIPEASTTKVRLMRLLVQPQTMDFTEEASRVR